MTQIKKLLRRAIKDGFDLSNIPDYTPRNFSAGLYEYLVSRHFIVTEDQGIIYVGYDILQDTAEITIFNTTMKVKPLLEEGFFDILIELFRYVGKIATKTEENKDNSDISTEDYSEDESSEEEWWL